jgi:hypothetical protein
MAWHGRAWQALDDWTTFLRPAAQAERKMENRTAGSRRALEAVDRDWTVLFFSKRICQNADAPRSTLRPVRAIGREFYSFARCQV